MRSRVFNVIQYERNPVTGETLNFSEENIKSCIDHKTIKQYAYIKHDKDLYTVDDEKNGYKAGEPKAIHYHVVLRCDNAIELETIAKWLDIPVQYIDVPKGKGAFLDCVQYLTHESEKEQAKGKHLYADNEVIANFDFRKEINEREEKKLKYGKDLTREQEIFHNVLYEGKTIRQIIDEDSIFYMEHHKKLDEYRMMYIQKSNPPTTRLNFYVCGSGGAGKDLLCRALARSLFYDLKNDDDIFFEVGSEKTTFEGYDGQPVIIWSDCRAYELIQKLGSRGNVFRVFDTPPTKARQNIKYGSTNLINQVNIVNSVQPYKEFLDGLAGEYVKDGVLQKSEENEKSQSYRRFPFIIPIYEEDFSLLINCGFLDDDKNFLQYMEYKHIKGNMQKIAELCGHNEQLIREIEQQTLKLVTEKYNEILDKQNEELNDDVIREMLKEYGNESNDLSKHCEQYEHPEIILNEFPF